MPLRVIDLIHLSDVEGNKVVYNLEDDVFLCLKPRLPTILSFYRKVEPVLAGHADVVSLHAYSPPFPGVAPLLLHSSLELLCSV